MAAEIIAAQAAPETLGVAAPDPHTLVLTLKGPTPYLLGLLASQREIFRIGNDAAATTGNLSPLIAAAVM